MKQAPGTPLFNPHNAKRGRMNTARRLLSATVFGCRVVFCLFMIGCASTRAVVEPPVETASPPPVVDPAPSPPIGPPPGYVKPENYWVREKIVLGEVTTIVEQPMSPEPAPSVSATPKRLVKKGKKSKKTGKRFTESEATSILEAMHIEDPKVDHMAYRDANALYPHVESYPLLRKILDTFMVPKLKDHLSFGEPGDGTLFKDQ
jgi:hypothetical protein